MRRKITRRMHITLVILSAASMLLAGGVPLKAALVGPMIQMTGGGSWWSSVCYNPHSDQYLVNWVNIGSDGKWRTTLRRISAETGELLGSDVIAYPNPQYSSYSAAAAYNSSNHNWFLVISIEVNTANNETDIIGQNISSDGTQIGGNIDLAGGPGYQDNPLVSYNSVNNNYLLVWHEGPSIKGKLIAGDVVPGNPSQIGPTIQISDATPYNKGEHRVAYNPVVNEYLVVWSDYRNYPPGSTENDNDWGDIYGQRINAATGALIGGNIPIYWGGSPYVRNGMDIPDITCNTTDGRYFIGITKLTSTYGWTTKGLIINHDGSWHSSLFDVSHPGRGASSGVAYNPNDNTYFMTYLSDGYQLTGRQFSANGEAVGWPVSVYSTPYEVNFGALAVRPSDGQYMQVTTLFEHLVTHSRPYVLVAQRFNTKADTCPPENVRPFRAYRQPDGKVLLTWSTAADQDVYRVTIRYRTDRYPESPTDGLLVCDRAAALKTSDSFLHFKSPGQTLYYTAFTRDSAGNYSSGVNASPSDVWLNETFDQYGLSVLEAFGGWTKADGKNSCVVQDSVFAGVSGKAVEIWAGLGQYDDASIADFGNIAGGYHKISFDISRNVPPTPGAQENQSILEVYGGGLKILRFYWSTNYKILIGPGNTITELVPSPVSGRWYHIELGVDLVNRVLDIWVDGTQVISGKPFWEPASSIDRILLTGFTGATVNSYIDNLKGERINVTSPPAAPSVVQPALDEAVETPYPKVVWSGEAHDRFQVRINKTNIPDDGSVFDSGEVVSWDSVYEAGPVEPGQDYYVFVRLHNSVGWGEWSAPGHRFDVTADNIRPSAPADFTTVGTNGGVRLNWRNPVDADLAGIMVRCRTDRYPISEVDGQLVTTLSGVVPGAVQTHIHTGLANGTRYYYSIFSIDDARLYSVPALDSAAPEPWAVEYHADALPSVSNPSWTLLDDGGSESYSHIESSQGVLHVLDGSTASGSKVRWYRDWQASSAVGSTVILRARCDSALFGPYSANVTLSDGSTQIDFVILPDRVASKTEGSTALDRQYLLDGTVFHEYRFTLKNSLYACYVDEDPTPVFTGTAYANTVNQVLFGANGSAASQSIYYDYLCYRTDGASPPVNASPQVSQVDISGAKLSPNGRWVGISGGTVSAVFNDSFYIQSPDGLQGLRIDKAGHGASAGDVVDITGTMASDDNWERFLLAQSVKKTGTGVPLVVGVRASMLGGADFQFDPVLGTGQRGIDGGSGLNNVGLLVRTWGRVTEVDSGGFFLIDDGSGPVKVISSGSYIPSGWPYVLVTGVCTLDVSSGLIRPAVRLRPTDVVTVGEGG